MKVICATCYKILNHVCTECGWTLELLAGETVIAGRDVFQCVNPQCWRTIQSEDERMSHGICEPCKMNALADFHASQWKLGKPLKDLTGADIDAAISLQNDRGVFDR